MLVLTGSAVTHLKQDLQGAMKDAHPPSQEDEEGHHELQEVVAKCLEAMDPPRGLVQEVGHGVGHRLRLWNRRTPVSCTLSPTSQGTPAGLYWPRGVHWPV